MNNILSKTGKEPYMRPLGTMTFSVFGSAVSFMGGPYRAKPEHIPGVKMAEEIEADCRWDVPTEDFSVPEPEDLYNAAVQSIAFAIFEGRTVYVGCMGGRGRTGLFLASVAFLTGSDNPVRDVRNNYYPHAVETAEQEQFVKESFGRHSFRKDVMAELYRLNGRSIVPDDWSWFRAMSFKDKFLWLSQPFRKHAIA